MKLTILLLILTPLLNSSSSFAQPGTLDSTFSRDGIVFTSIGGSYDAVSAIAIQKNGKILAAGYSEDSAAKGKSAFALIRYLNHGKLDPSFGNNGIVTTYFHDKSSVARAIAIQNDGKIVLAGYVALKWRNGNYAFAIARYLPNGNLDYSFGQKGQVITDIDSNVDAANAIAIQPDGKIVVTGYTYNKDTPSRSMEIAVVRYNPNGARDSSFGTNGIVITDVDGWRDNMHPHNDDYANAVAVLPNGKIIVGGASEVFDGGGAFALVRYKSNGSTDSSFGKNGMAFPFGGYGSEATSMMILPNGKILLAGYTLTIGPGGFTLAQCKKDGTLDSSFGNNGIVLASHYSSYGKSVAVQQNGKIIMAGFSYFDSNKEQLELIRFTPRGVLDSSFGTNGVVFSDLQCLFTSGSNSYRGTLAPVVALQKNGKIVVAGNGNTKSSVVNKKFAVVRYNGDPVNENHFSDNILSKQILTNTSSPYFSPNPVKDILYIQNLSSSTKTISIFNLNGKVLQQAVTANNNYSFNVNQLSAGIYFVKLMAMEKLQR